MFDMIVVGHEECGVGTKRLNHIEVSERYLPAT